MKHWKLSLGLSLMMGAAAISTAYALEVEGIQIADKATVGEQALVLNGAGVRSKFFFDIYIGALYLPSKTKSDTAAISSKGNKRVLMHFLYDEVSKDKLVNGWNEGFENNTKNLAELQARLNQFNNFFQDMKKGDVVVYDFTDNGKTTVIINDKVAGSIEGADFQQALLAVWLGEDPADDDLKEGMLGDD